MSSSGVRSATELDWKANKWEKEKETDTGRMKGKEGQTGQKMSVWNTEKKGNTSKSKLPYLRGIRGFSKDNTLTALLITTQELQNIRLAYHLHINQIPE